MSDKPLNILFLMADQLRTDHVSCYPGARMSTPNLDRLAAGIVFRDCVSVNPVCTPARSALLTGKYAHQVGMLCMSGDLSRQYPTYPRALQQAGYWTAGVGKFHWLQTWPWPTGPGQGLNIVALADELKEFGFDHIWEACGKQLAVKNFCHYARHLHDKGLLDTYRQYVTARRQEERRLPDVPLDEYLDGDPSPLPEEDYIDIVTADRIIEAIRNRPVDRPFFLFGSFCGPHPPYDPPPRYLEMFDAESADDFVVAGKPISDSEKARWFKLRRSYKAMIRCLDDQVGRVLDCLEQEGLADDTVVLFTADHGEMLGDRGLAGKSVPWSPSAVVPTVIRHPYHLSGQANDSTVELIDLTATMLEVAGLSPADALSKSWPAYNDRVPCRSLLPILEGRADYVREFAFSECYNFWEMIQTPDWLYVHRCRYDDPDRPPDEFYDRRRDPNTLDNRIDDPACRDAIQWCRNRLQHLRDATPQAQTTWATYGQPQP